MLQIVHEVVELCQDHGTHQILPQVTIVFNLGTAFQLRLAIMGYCDMEHGHILQ